MSGDGSSARDAEVTLRICALLNSMKAMHEARSSTGLREALSGHVFAFLHDLIPADTGGVSLNDEVRHDSQEWDLLRRVADERGPIHEDGEEGSILAVPLLVRQETA